MSGPRSTKKFLGVFNIRPKKTAEKKAVLPVQEEPKETLEEKAVLPVQEEPKETLEEKAVLPVQKEPKKILEDLLLKSEILNSKIIEDLLLNSKTRKILIDKTEEEKVQYAAQYAAKYADKMAESFVKFCNENKKTDLLDERGLKLAKEVFEIYATRGVFSMEARVNFISKEKQSELNYENKNSTPEEDTVEKAKKDFEAFRNDCVYLYIKNNEVAIKELLNNLKEITPVTEDALGRPESNAASELEKLVKLVQGIEKHFGKGEPDFSTIDIKYLSPYLLASLVKNIQDAEEVGDSSNQNRIISGCKKEESYIKITENMKMIDDLKEYCKEIPELKSLLNAAPRACRHSESMIF